MRIAVTGIIVILAALFSSGCSSVAFHERGRLQDPVMQLSDSGVETHFYQKVYYSREGSVGGIGSSAGGGCGCY